MDIRDAATRDAVGGAGIAVTGAATSVYAAVQYPFGTLSRMDSGFFPFLLGLLLVLFGVILLVSALGRIWRAERELSEIRFELKPFISVLAAVLLFAVIARPFGLVPAIVLTTLTATATDRNIRWAEAAILAVLLTGLSIVVFKVLLGLQFILFRWPF